LKPQYSLPRSATKVNAFRWLLVAFLLLATAVTLLGSSQQARALTFTGSELLGRPTDSAIVVNILADEALEMYLEYGTTSGSLTQQTTAVFSTANVPSELEITGLQPDTRYYYRLLYRELSSSTFVPRPERTFHTQRASGETYTFTIQADSHLGQPVLGDQTMYFQTLANQTLDQPDFMIDLGDSVRVGPSESSIVGGYLLQRQALGLLNGSIPVFMVLGNVENEEGWFRDGTPNNPAVIGTNARKLYYPNPVPNQFYSGDTDDWSSEGVSGDGLRESYFAFEWGDALFVVLDPFWHTTTKPHDSTGGSDPGTGSGDGWDWTLGDNQYFWLKETLEQSNATFKFVFSHHSTSGPPDELFPRGGVEAAPYFEWGGSNANGSYGFNVRRPSWPMPVHDLMVANGVDIFFHGHDHLFAYEELDGIIYQLVPQPSDPSYGTGWLEDGNYYNNANLVNNSGHLRVTVGPNGATIEYVRAFLNGESQAGFSNLDVAYSYVVPGGQGNIPPVANNDSASVTNGGAVVIDVLNNDSDANNHTLMVTAVSQGSSGSVTTNGTTVTYTHNGSAATTDSFTYIISDGNGGSDTATVFMTINTPGGTPTATTAPPTATPGSGGSVTFNPVADAAVLSNRPDNVFPNTTLATDGSPIINSYLRFDVQGVTNISSAKLRLFANDSNSLGITAAGVSDNSWVESTLTYNTAPPAGATIGSSTAVNAGTFTEIDVTTYVTGSGLFSFRVSSADTSRVTFNSREGNNPPQLVIVSAGGPTPTPTNPPPPTATASNTPVPTATNTLGPTATNTNTPIPTATNTPGPTATSTNTPPPTTTATNTPIPTATATATASPTPPPSGGETIYLSSTGSGTAGSVSFSSEDIVAYDSTTGLWSMFFDGSDMGIGLNNLDAFALLDDGSILMSFTRAQTIGSLADVDDSDIIRFVPTSLGDTTAGSFEWFLDGSDVGLTSAGEDVDAIGWTADGRLLISVIGNASAGTITASDQQLLVLDNAVFGETSSGDWALYFNGTTADLSANSEDINGTWLDATNGNIYLTTSGSFTVGSVSGDASDIFVCTPTTLGTSTTCSYALFWDAAAAGFGGNIDGISMTR
jgi:hypothetical protein